MNGKHFTALLKFSAVIFFSVLIINGCKEAEQVIDGGIDPDPATGEESSFNGQIIDFITGSPIQDASVVVTGGPSELTLTTDTQGKYSGTFKLTAGVNLTLLTVKSGYLTDTTSIFLPKGKVVTVTIIEMEKQSTNTTPSGEPKSVWLKSLSSTVIGVKESGSEETSRIVFEVQDSAGVPIDLTHSVDVAFSFGSHPNGGEILNPPLVKTNNSGLAVVNLTSGFKAGVVQVIAEITRPGGAKISSLPVPISIHGGLPDSVHFTIATDLYNIPGWNYIITVPIFAYVGDKFSNPVRPFTSVYFETTGGIISGSALTNDGGVGSVNLITSAPNPVHPVFGPGFATITARTADEYLNTISKQMIVLFSGVPIIEVEPQSIDVPHLGSQSFNYIVRDQNQNPLSKGTSITVTVDGENVKVLGDTQISLPDTQSKFWTQFSFVIYDSNDSLNVVKSVSAKISVDGPNGTSSRTIYGIGR
ncbi:MAG: hypothetical protein AUK34_04820 [Ignavibacteria bacterium CG2_30_36_16]|nr:MAG: hypothetical protein AUK34_04820 [Ignavibacteria bacterium CG2_30_36_16]